MFQLNSINARQNLQMNVAIAYRENGVLSNVNNPQFSLCCENGKVLLPNLFATPQELEVLLTSKEFNAVKFRN